jgi:twitching motility protein PilT
VESSGEHERAHRADGAHPAAGDGPESAARRTAAEPYVPEKFAFEGSAPAPAPAAPAPTQAPRMTPPQHPQQPQQPQQPGPQPGHQAGQPGQPPAQYHQQPAPAPGPPSGPAPGQSPGVRPPQPAPRASTGPAAPQMVPPQPPPGGQRLQPQPDGAAQPGALLVEERPVPEFDLHAALGYLLQTGGSDLHLSVGSPPMIRLRGELEAVPDQMSLTPQAVQKVLYAILTQKQRERFEEELELDFAYAMPGASRFRVNVYRQRESLGAAFRVIPFEIKTLGQLGINPRVATMAALPRGMVLVTGPTGSGKSTTLAALVDEANRTRRDHIMTVEDPIEFLHKNKSCLVNQREVGEDTHSFGAALKHVLRQDPDIILVGEMRDLETISVALTAAETGHLVFATLHTQDAAQTIDRVIDVFPPHQQQQVRVQLASAIQGVVCQTLCKTADGKGRAAATEVMFATGAIRNLIREGKTHQIYSSMQAGAQHGMQTMDQNLAELVKQHKITFEHGLEKCHHVDDFKRLTGHP